MMPTPAEVRPVIVGAMLAMFLAALDQTIVATALPPIAGNLGGFALISWVVTSYLLTSVCVTPVFGKLSDLFGRRAMLVFCLLVFIAGSALCALAPTMIALIFARALQGIGGGGLLTLAQVIIADVVSPRERGRYAAWFSGVWAVSSLLGPVLGGILTEHAGWPWIFWINLPLGLLALLISERALRRLPVAARRPAIDYPGIALLSAGTVALLLLLSLGGKQVEWTSPAALGLAAAAVISGALFAVRQRMAPEPILPPHFLRDPVVGPSLASIFVVFGSYLALAVLAPVYFQVALGCSASEAGLLMIPLMFSSTVTAGLAGRYARTAGRYKRQPLIGLPVSVAFLALLATMATSLTPMGAAALLTLVGFGIGPIFPCTIVAAQNAVEVRDIGAVSGAIGFARSLGGAIGTAAGSALVLGLITGISAGTGRIGSLEDLAARTLGPVERHIVAQAFAALFAATAVALAAAAVLYALVEERALHDRTAVTAVGE